MDENETYDIDELMNEALESDLLEATTTIQDTLITIHDTLNSCVNLLLIADILLAIIIGIICALIFSRFLKVDF